MRDLDTSRTDAEQARIVGNLAGVVEWANDAFARLSGIALDETLDKPVGRLLERAGIDLEIVEFVAQHFFEGRLCRVAFPFERPDGRRIDVLLEVEALRDAVGEIDRFVAIAREAPTAAASTEMDARGERASGAARRRSSAASSPATTGVARALASIDLNAAVRRGLAGAFELRRSARSAARPELDIAFELDLQPDLDPVAVAVANACDHDTNAAVDVLVTALCQAALLAVEEAGNAGSVITLSTARLPAQRRFVSKVHAIAACPADRSQADAVVLELHDTALALPPAFVATLARRDLGATLPRDASARMRALTSACAQARALGARVHLDSTPGCGNQLLVLFPPALFPPAVSTRISESASTLAVQATSALAAPLGGRASPFAAQAR